MGGGEDPIVPGSERSYWGGGDGRTDPALTAREIGWYGDLDRRVIASWDSDGTRRYRLTDRRGALVVRECLLCTRRRRLRLSHVHPAWTGEAHRGEGGFVRGYRRDTGDDLHLEQDFAKHYLLCDECEQFVGESENYVKRLSRGQPSDLTAIGVARTGYRADGLRRDLVFRFIASFLLRSHAAVSAPHIRLPHGLVTELRSSIVQDDFAPSRHQLSIAKVYSAAPGVNPRAHAIRHLHLSGGRAVFEVLLGGLYFVYFLRAPTRRNRGWDEDEFRLLMEPVSVGASDTLILPVEMLDLNILKQDAGVSLDTEVSLPPVQMDDPCPCGWGVGSLRECCGSTWLRELGSP